MTDSKTATELQAMLDTLRLVLKGCRRTESAGFDTYWISADALDASLDKIEQAVSTPLGNVDKGTPQGADGNLDKAQVDWLRFMPDGWDGTPPTVGSGTLTAKQVCEVKWHDIDYNGEADEWTCLSCGEQWIQETDWPAACPWCGKAVKR